MAPIEPDHNAVERTSLPSPSKPFPLPPPPHLRPRTSILTPILGQLKQVIQILYEAMIQVNTYDAHTVPVPAPAGAGATTTTNGAATTPARATRDVLAAQLTQLSTALQDIHRLAGDAQASGTLSDIPRELILYVDNGRNPDIYTREFVELVRRENQLMRGKMRAFGSFRDVLGRELANANPELREDVARVVVRTGGEWPPKNEAGQ